MPLSAARATASVLAFVIVSSFVIGACAKPVHDTLDDATITTRVKTALLNDPNVGALKIDVDTYQGVVTLSGSVKSRDEEQRAIGIARKTPGVKDVKSTLQVPG